MNRDEWTLSRTYDELDEEPLSGLNVGLTPISVTVVSTPPVVNVVKNEVIVAGAIVVGDPASFVVVTKTLL